MTTNGLPVRHPIIQHFYTQFRETYPTALGFCLESMDEYRISRMHLDGSYFVCASEIKLYPKEHILFKGPSNKPGQTLLAGRIVDVKSIKVEFIGTQDEPVVILGLEGVSITATELSKIKNLTLYLLEGATLALNFATISAFENVQVVRLRLEDSKLITRAEFDWKTHADYRNSTFMTQEPSHI